MIIILHHVLSDQLHEMVCPYFKYDESDAFSSKQVLGTKKDIVVMAFVLGLGFKEKMYQVKNVTLKENYNNKDKNTTRHLFTFCVNLDNKYFFIPVDFLKARLLQ